MLPAHCRKGRTRIPFMPSRIAKGLLFVVLGLITACTGFSQSLHKTNSVEETLYDPDPGHIANRLYKALFTWKGDEESAPSHWPKQKVALDISTVNALLDELLQTKISKEFPDPAKRVFLQRDLWLIFDWLAEQRGAIDGKSRHPTQTGTFHPTPCPSYVAIASVARQLHRPIEHRHFSYRIRPRAIRTVRFCRAVCGCATVRGS